MLKESVKQRARGTFLYSPLRDTYRFIFNRDYRKRRKQMVAFYAQFMSKGNLVFDVGANVGEYTEVFLDLGARVIAIEPNPDLIPILKQIRPTNHVTVEWVALGSSTGEATLFICNYDGLYTISPKRVNSVTNNPKYEGRDWGRQVRIPLTSLNAMIAKYGEPAFIKIDVEGFECEVLSGLSGLPKSLSFEFQSDSLELAIASINQKCLPPTARFNCILGSPLGRKPRPIKFALEKWVKAESLVELLRGGNILDGASYGEIFVRKLQ